MFTYPVFDVEIVRRVEASGLGWPARLEAGDDSGLGWNRTYSDLRGFSWADARRVAALERELIAGIEFTADTDKEYEAREEELAESERYLYGLDLGIASCVVALYAANAFHSVAAMRPPSAGTTKKDLRSLRSTREFRP